MTNFYDRPWELEPMVDADSRLHFAAGAVLGLLAGLLPAAMLLVR